MLRKTLLTLGIALASCNVFATDYSNYSYTQLQQEYSRLEQATRVDLTVLVKLANAVKEEFGGKSKAPYDLFEAIHGLYFYHVNKDFRVVGNNYYHDPRVTNLVNLIKVCAEFWKRTKELNYEACQTSTFLLILSGGDINALQTLAILAPGKLIRDYPEYEVTAQHTLLAQVAKNLLKYNYSFTLNIPRQEELLNNQLFTKFVSSILNINLTAPN